MKTQSTSSLTLSADILWFVQTPTCASFKRAVYDRWVTPHPTPPHPTSTPWRPEL